MLMSTDEYTQKYMEDNGDNFPEASFNVIMRKIKAPAANFPSLQEYCVDLLARLDKNGDHFVDYREFADGLRAMNIMVTQHEAQALMRRLDRNGDGKISMEEFYAGLSQEF